MCVGFVFACVCICVYVYVFACVCVRLGWCVGVCVCVSVNVFVCMCVSACKCVRVSCDGCARSFVHAPVSRTRRCEPLMRIGATIGNMEAYKDKARFHKPGRCVPLGLEPLDADKASPDLERLPFPVGWTDCIASSAGQRADAMGAIVTFVIASLDVDADADALPDSGEASIPISSSASNSLLMLAVFAGCGSLRMSDRFRQSWCPAGNTIAARRLECLESLESLGKDETLERRGSRTGMQKNPA